jgi:putative modified peptide
MAATPLTPDLVDKLLDKLSSDDQFRADFQSDPQATMIQLGAPADFECGECWFDRLASKDQIQNTRDDLKDQLLGLEDMAYEYLEAST